MGKPVPAEYWKAGAALSGARWISESFESRGAAESAMPSLIERARAAATETDASGTVLHTAVSKYPPWLACREDCNPCGRWCEKAGLEIEFQTGPTHVGTCCEIIVQEWCAARQKMMSKRRKRYSRREAPEPAPVIRAQAAELEPWLRAEIVCGVRAPRMTEPDDRAVPPPEVWHEVAVRYELEGDEARARECRDLAAYAQQVEEAPCTHDQPYVFEPYISALKHLAYWWRDEMDSEQHFERCMKAAEARRRRAGERGGP